MSERIDVMAGRLSAHTGVAGGSRLALTLGLALGFVAIMPGSRSVSAQGRGSLSAGGAGSRSDPGELHYTNKRSFRIPFDIDKEGRSKIKEVQLWASEDSGEHWKAVSKTTPDRPSFTFRAAHDGEFWFAVRIFGVDGQFYPSVNDTVVPGMKVLVDTKPPALVLEPDGRRGTAVQVRWEVRDEHLDLKTLVVEYQVEGAREWGKVPIKKPSLIGSQRWVVETADAVRVRALVADKAGNETEAKISIPEGTGSLPEEPSDAGEEYAPPPSIAQVSDSGISAGPGFGPVGEELEERRPKGGGTGRVKNSSARARPQSRLGQAAPATSRSVFDEESAGVKESHAGSGAGGSVFDSLPASQGMAVASTAISTGQSSFVGSPTYAGTSPTQSTPAGNTSEPLLVSSPRFSLQYAVDDAGPNGPATVELWVTPDGGRTWSPRGNDPDRVSPVEVDLGGEGTFGIRLVSRSAFGLGDRPPAPGDPPDRWVEVDASPPLVHLYQIQVGTGVHAGKVAIRWRITDPHLASRSARLLWRTDQPGAAWQPIIAEPQENIGQFVWSVPPGFPGKFHLRVEATDTVGHLGGAETTDSGPIIVDRSRPKSRILGLDPNARGGVGPSSSQIR